MTITKRSTKGSALTYLEMDGNLTHMEGLEQRLDRIDNSDATPKIYTSGVKTAAYRPGEVIEVLSGLCNGADVTVQSGTYTFPNVTGVQNINSNDSYVDVTGSNLAYTPPTGTTRVVYEFSYLLDGLGTGDDPDPVGHFRFYIDSAEVENARFTVGDQSQQFGDKIIFRWVVGITGFNVPNDGILVSWTSAKTLKMQARRYSSNHNLQLHEANYWDGSSADQFSRPMLTITAIA